MKPDKVEQPDPNIQLEWYANGRVVCYIPKAFSEDIRDKWIDIIVSTIAQWPLNQPYLAIYDISVPKVALNFLNSIKQNTYILGLSNLGQAEVDHVIARRGSPFQAQIAMLFNLRFSGQLANVLTTPYQVTALIPNLEIRNFLEEHKALDWLLQPIR